MTPELYSLLYPPKRQFWQKTFSRKYAVSHGSVGWESRAQTLFPRVAVERNPETIESFRYRPDSWTARQLVHHCADSHINALIRLKLALTEDNPTVKPYLEDLWANLVDTQLCPLSDSLNILNGVHSRWSAILANLNLVDLERLYFHPGMNETLTIAQLTRLYAWHCQHHLAHLLQAEKNFKNNIKL